MTSLKSKGRKIAGAALAFLLITGLTARHCTRETSSQLPAPPATDHAGASASPMPGQASMHRPAPSVSGPIRRIGAKAFVLDGNLIAPDGKAVDVIRALEAPARIGDGQAAMMLSLKLMSCRHAIKHQDDDGLLLAEAQVFGGLDEALQRRDAGLALCEGITPEDLSQLGDWLERAADSGNINAQILYASSANTILTSPAEMLRSPDRIVKFKTRAMSYLISAANDGSADALWHLGNTYRDGYLAARDDTRAYAYFLAGMKASAGDKPWQMEQLETSLSSQQRRDATILAKEIYRDCCEIN